MTTNYDGLTRNNWPGTWVPNGSFPIALDTELRGGLQSISGGSGDRLTDISGQRIVEGMLVYLKTGYTAGAVTRASNSYYTYKLENGQSRNATTGAMPNAEFTVDSNLLTPLQCFTCFGFGFFWAISSAG